MNYKLDEKSQGAVGWVRRQMRACRFGLHQIPRGVGCGLFLANFLAVSVYAQTLVTGVFNTGVDNSGAVLASYALDSHYQLIASADTNFPGPNTVVVDDTIYPLATANWLADSSASKWIAPHGNQDNLANPANGDMLGYYTYRTTFDLTGYEPNQMVLTGRWSCESLGTDVQLNGVSTGNATSDDIFAVHLQWNPLLITRGFVQGTNTLDFVVNRVAYGSPTILPTGLRAEFVVSNLPPTLQITPAGTDVFIWWRTNHASGFVLETSASVGPDQHWTVVSDPAVVVGDQHVVAVDMTANAAFFRLRQP